MGYHFLGGVLKHAKGLTALFAPTVNSYRRLGANATTSGSTWTPRYISYGGNNRSHMLRIPESGRFECRLIDGSANMYLALAGLLAAGIDGLKNETSPGDRIDENLFARGAEFPNLETLPTNLFEALAALKQNPLLLDMLGELSASTFFEFKQKRVGRILLAGNRLGSRPVYQYIAAIHSLVVSSIFTFKVLSHGSRIKKRVRHN